jgi:hypothetical protein
VGGTAGASLKSIHVLRKPCSDSTVAANVLKFGTGALNIDVCRITAKHEVNPSIARREAAQKSGRAPITGRNALESTADGRIERRGSHEVYMAAHPGEQLGRWPANLILQHFEDCRQDGFRTVKSDGHYPAARPGGSQVSGPAGHQGQDGLVERYTEGETVATWTCEPGCPVAALDAQSGVLSARGNVTSLGHGSGNGGGVTGWGKGRRDEAPRPELNVPGGASRFFKQVGGTPDSLNPVAANLRGVG